MGGNSIPRNRIISYLKACKMISKGCLYHIVSFQDLDSGSPSLEFSKVIPNDLPGIPPEQEMDFCIDLLQDTNPISIPPYKMTPAE